MSESHSFLDQVMTGAASIDGIDDFVERWHSGDGRQALREDLGMTIDEYLQWLRNPEDLSAILVARQRQE